MPESDKRVRGVVEVARTWARGDLDAAIDWASKLEVERERNKALFAIANDRRVIRNNSSGAMRAGMLVSDENQRDHSLRRIVQYLYPRDRQAAKKALAACENLLSADVRTKLQEYFGLVDEALGDTQLPVENSR